MIPLRKSQKMNLLRKTKRSQIGIDYVPAASARIRCVSKILGSGNTWAQLGRKTTHWKAQIEVSKGGTQTESTALWRKRVGVERTNY